MLDLSNLMKGVNNASYLLCHLKQGLIVTFPFSFPLGGFLLQCLNLLGHLWVDKYNQEKQK